MISDLGLNRESEAGVPNQNPAPADEGPLGGHAADQDALDLVDRWGA